MKRSKNREEVLKLIFAQYPAVQKFHLTSDDQAFTNIDNARAHSKSLEDKSVTICNRNGNDEPDGDIVKADQTDADVPAQETAAKTAEELAADKEEAERLAAEKAALKALRDEYKVLAGKGVNNAWTAEEVSAKIAELKAKK